MKNCSKSGIDSSNDHINVAIVGAGQLGSLLANELLYNPKSKYRPVFFIEKNPTKLGNSISGLKIYPENEEVYTSDSDTP